MCRPVPTALDGAGGSHTTGSLSMPRNTHPPATAGFSGSRRRPGSRENSSGRATSATSARATHAPAHTWTPLPNARCAPWSRRVRSKRSGCGHSFSSRLAESKHTPSLEPAGRCTPWSTVSRVVWRGYMPMGATHRMLSSNTAFHREGSLPTSSRCSGWLSSAHEATPRASRGSLRPPPIVILMLARIECSGIRSPDMDSNPEMRESSGCVRCHASISSIASSTSANAFSPRAHTSGSFA